MKCKHITIISIIIVCENLEHHIHLLNHDISFLRSLRLSTAAAVISLLRPTSLHTYRLNGFRGLRSVRPLLGGGPSTTVERITGACNATARYVLVFCSPASFGGHTWSQHDQLTLLVIMVPLIHDESAQIASTLFRAKTTNFAG